MNEAALVGSPFRATDFISFSGHCKTRETKLQKVCFVGKALSWFDCTMRMQAFVTLTFSFMEWCICKIYVYSSTRFLYSSIDFGYYVQMWLVDRHTGSSKYLH